MSDTLRRGDIVTIALSSDNGKPRPALVVQADSFCALPSVTVLRISSELQDAPLIRILVSPDPENGLRAPSQIMVDKAITVPRSKLGRRIGRAAPALIRSVDNALQVLFGLKR
jgi:mRNA interferase MazF